MREEVVPNAGNVYLIVHMKDTSADALPKEARQYLLTTVPPAMGTVIVGGTAVMRMGVNVIARSIIALSRKHLLMKVVGTDEEAWACIANWRSASAADHDQAVQAGPSQR
jgi:hypothetical protein